MCVDHVDVTSCYDTLTLSFARRGGVSSDSRAFQSREDSELFSLSLSHTHTHTHSLHHDQNRSDVDWFKEVKCEDHEDCATCTSSENVRLGLVLELVHER